MSFEPNRHWKAVRFQFRFFFTKNLSMSVFRKALLMSAIAMRGLVSTQMYGLITKFFCLKKKIFETNMTEDTLISLQRDTKTFIRLLCQLGGSLAQRANVHHLEEIAFRDLPTWNNVRFFRTQSFEMRHKLAKAAIRNTNKRDIEGTMANFDNVLSTLRYVYHGGRWGADLRYQAGESLMRLAQTPGANKPPTCIRSLTNYHWLVPASFQFRPQQWHCKGSKKPLNLSDNVMESIKMCIDTFCPHLDCTTFFSRPIAYECSRWLWMEDGMLQSDIQNGDVVKVNFNSNDEICRVETILCLQIGSEELHVFIPAWYEKKGKHAQLHLQQVRGWPHSGTICALPASLIIEPVMLTHSCDSTCKVVKKGSMKQIQHNYEVDLFYVLDRANGFTYT
eukprot:TRINITY_DN496_c0_g1_i6.p1 TRINITY_DN496_c0_g1~~TRINITY_DN496_c0_g1_i6.p1  ORF type:complete len:392 (-),score=-34.55 TRINITY_DN496_c0_g1_i6:74-1249(-)